MPSQTVLLTGATGFIGFRVLVQLLSTDFTVRAAVRSSSSADKIFSSPSVSAIKDVRTRLSFVEVPDIEAEGAYDHALADGQVENIVHVASPIMHKYTGDAQKDLIDPAVRGTIGMLTSAKNTPGGSVKRVIITSSFFGNYSRVDPAASTTSETRIAVPQPPYQDPVHAYNASKVAALNAGDDFMAKHKPMFDVVNIMPGIVRGSNELASSMQDFLQGTAATAIRHMITDAAQPMPVVMNSAHVETIAQLHVLALNPQVKGNQSFGAWVYDKPEAFFGYLKEAFPKAVAKGVFKDRPVLPVESPKGWDTTSTKEVFGESLFWGDGRAQVVDTARTYLRLLGEPLA